MRALIPALAAAIAVLTVPGASAQSLAEAAARNKDKKKPTKVYTEADLRGRPGAATVSQPGATGVEQPATTAAGEEKKTEGGKPAEKTKTEEELRAEREAAWRERLSKAEADVNRLSSDASRIEQSLGDLTGPLYGGNRAALLGRLEETKKQLAAAQATLADIQEEGRRSNFR